ncbi:hypothetical protein IGI04_035611 [Brassica rapa subsp. trilocularis]|uniref:Uncharacterized protein n=1 Tax=Brassica rapa subsp. trilocularis TaxID=1813537 RepID=A0ABQ7LFU7_BRACM|nr:hypothetical protein IGI04_035611 [Brassica rapa subsp. trilocularis]
MERLLVLVKSEVDQWFLLNTTQEPNSCTNSGLCKHGRWYMDKALLEQITLLKGNFGSISFDIEKLTGNSIAVDFSKSVMCDGCFNSYLALEGPSWLHDQIQRETARDDCKRGFVHDIRHDCVNREFWDVIDEPPTTTRMKRPKSYPATDAKSTKRNNLVIKTVEVEKDIIVQIRLQEKLITCTSIEANVSDLLAPMNEKLETMEKDFQRMKEKI